MKELINNIIESNKIDLEEHERLANKCGYAFLTGMYKARIESILNDLETLKERIENV
jgi:hypothetical protein